LGKVAIELLLQLYLFDFYTRILGLSPLLTGTAFAIAILWDALSDIIVAVALFKARAQKIRYSSIIGIGTVILAVATGTLFSPLNENSQTYLFFHLLFTYVLVNTGMTLLDLPQSSLSAELTQKANERNKLLASRMGLGIVGLCAGSVLPGLLIGIGNQATSNELIQASRTDSAWWLGLVVIVCGILSILGLRGREAEIASESPPIPPSLNDVKAITKDSAFMNLVIAQIIAAVGRTINASLALMYYCFVLSLSEKQVTQIIFPIFTLSIVLSIPLWIYLAKLFGKKVPAYISVGSLGIMGIIAYPTLPEGQLIPTALISAFGGALCGAAFLIDSMITDLIDADERQTGKRKESLYFAVSKSALKVSRAIAFVGVGIGLNIIELDTSSKSISEDEKNGIVLLFGIAVGLCFLVGSYFIKRANVPSPQVN